MLVVSRSRQEHLFMLSMPLFSFRAAQDNVLSVFQVLKPSFMDLPMELQNPRLYSNVGCSPRKKLV